MKGEIGLAIGTAVVVVVVVVVFNRRPEVVEALVGEVAVEDGDVAS